MNYFQLTFRTYGSRKQLLQQVSQRKRVAFRRHWSEELLNERSLTHRLKWDKYETHCKVLKKCRIWIVSLKNVEECLFTFILWTVFTVTVCISNAWIGVISTDIVDNPQVGVIVIKALKKTTFWLTDGGSWGWMRQIVNKGNINYIL